MNETTTAAAAAMLLDDWLDPLEAALREGVHSYLRELLELEVTQVLGRLHYRKMGVGVHFPLGYAGRRMTGRARRASHPGAIPARRSSYATLPRLTLPAFCAGRAMRQRPAALLRRCRRLRV